MNNVRPQIYSIEMGTNESVYMKKQTGVIRAKNWCDSIAWIFN